MGKNCRLTSLNFAAEPYLCIIGAGLVVKGKIPSNSVYAGNPGKVIMGMSIYEKIFLNHKHLFGNMYIDGPGSDKKARRAILKKHFGLEGL